MIDHALGKNASHPEHRIYVNLMDVVLNLCVGSGVSGAKNVVIVGAEIKVMLASEADVARASSAHSVFSVRSLGTVSAD